MGNNLCTFQCIKSKSFLNICNTETFQNSIHITSPNNRFCQDNDELDTPVFIDSYDPDNNFFFLANHIKLIQREFRKFIKRKHKEQEMAPYGLLDAPTGRYFININEEQLLKVSTEDKISLKKLNMSLYSNSLTVQSVDGNANASIKGYFLKKQKKYKYKGHLNGKKKTGYGKVTWEDGSVLYAEFENSKAQGICQFIDSSGGVFIGEYSNNRPLGYGKYIQGDEVEYEGVWHNNILNGLGTEIWKDKTLYQGNYNESNKEGIGLYRWPDGTIYQGEWENNCMNGFGTLIYTNERVYTGQFKNGMMNGYGEFLWPDKKRYVGYYEEEIKEGFGMFVWSSQPFIAYAGFWHEGKQHGVGVRINDTKVKFGVWKEGKKEIWLNNPWDMKRFLKKNQEKYLRFFEQRDSSLIKTIMNLTK